MKKLLNAVAFCLPTLVAVTSFPAAAASQTLPNGAVFWLGDAAYRSQADIPAGFYAGGAPALLENFEDRNLHTSLVASHGKLIGIGIFGNGANSVDADDGVIDNSGLLGVSWDANFFQPLRFTFNGTALPTAFGLAITGAGFSTSFRAFDGAGQLIAARSFDMAIEQTGVVTDDRFVGLQFASGIRAIEVTFGGGFINVDHVQYGQMAPIPEPESWALMAAGLAGLASLASRARRRADA